MRLLLYIVVIMQYAYCIPLEIAIGSTISSNNTQKIKKDISKDYTLITSYKINNYTKIQARYIQAYSSPSELVHDYSYGVFLKPYYSFENNISPYLLLGYTKNSLSRNNKNFINKTTTQSDYSYGIGIQYNINKKVSLFVDAIRLIDKSEVVNNNKYNIEINNITFGITYSLSSEKIAKLKKVTTTKEEVQSIILKKQIQKSYYDSYVQKPKKIAVEIKRCDKYGWCKIKNTKYYIRKYGFKKIINNLYVSNINGYVYAYERIKNKNNNSGYQRIFKLN